MSDTDTQTVTPPPDAGLSSRGSAGSGGPRRSGDDLIAAAAKGEDLREDEQVDLLDYFIANGDLPGDDDPVPLEFEIGEGRKRRTNTWQVHRIGWDEWTDAESRGRDEESGRFDGFVIASYVVARALVLPQLGPKVKAQQEEAKANPDGKIDGRDENGNPIRVKPPLDAAELLRRMFAKQGGTLLSMSAEVRRISKLSIDQQSARTIDQEVAAGEA